MREWMPRWIHWPLASRLSGLGWSGMVWDGIDNGWLYTHGGGGGDGSINIRQGYLIRVGCLGMAGWFRWEVGFGQVDSSRALHGLGCTVYYCIVQYFWRGISGWLAVDMINFQV